MNVKKKFTTKDKKEKRGKKVKRMGWEWEGTKKSQKVRNGVW